MTWPEQDPYSSPPYSSAPYPGSPQSSPPAGQYPQDPYAAQYPQGQTPKQQYAVPQYQQGYPGYGYQTPASAKTNTMAIVALVMAFVFSPAAIVCGHIARKQIRETGEQGGGMATAGLVIGYISVGLSVLGCGFIFLMAMLAESGSTY